MSISDAMVMVAEFGGMPAVRPRPANVVLSMIAPAPRQHSLRIQVRWTLALGSSGDHMDRSTPINSCEVRDTGLAGKGAHT